MGGYQSFGYPDPEEERRRQEEAAASMDLTQDPEALAGIAGARPPTMDLTRDPEALQGSPDWQKFNQSRASMRDELDDPPPSMDLTQDPEALNSPMLRQQAAARPQPPAAGMQTQGSLSALLPQRDPQMDARWRTAENTALDRSGYMGNQPYGAGEAVRDFAPLAVGGTLDILLNKGRGLGALSGAAMQANAQMAGNRQKEAEAAGRFASTARDQRESVGRQGLQFATEQRQQEQFDLSNNPDHPTAKAYAQKLIVAGVPAEMVEGLPLRQLQAKTAAYTPYFRHGAADLTNADAADRAGGVKRAQYGAQDEHYATELDQKAGIAAAETDARNQVNLGAAPQFTQAEVEKQKALIPGKVAEKVAYEEAGVGAGHGFSGHMSVDDLQASNPGLKFTNPKLVQDALTTRALTKDVITQIQAANRGAGVIDEMYKSAQEAREKFKQGDVMGAITARRQYQSHVEEYAGILGKISGSSGQQQQEHARELAPDPANPAALDIIKALWPSIAVNVKGNLGSYGIEARTPQILGGDQDARAPQPAAAPQRPGRTGFGSNVTEQLPVTGAPTPKVPVYRAGNGTQQAAGKAPMSGGAVNQVPTATPNGDGSFDIDGETYTADEVQKLKTKGLIR